MKIIISILILAVLLVAGCAQEEVDYSQIDFYSCNNASDCVPVDCSCSCSGCGGFSYDEIINKKYVEEWYEMKGCSSPQICPMVCCSPMKIVCDEGRCDVLLGSTFSIERVICNSNILSFSIRNTGINEINASYIKIYLNEELIDTEQNTDSIKPGELYNYTIAGCKTNDVIKVVNRIGLEFTKTV